jgi:magnesium-transporting ATPase (P-type)
VPKLSEAEFDQALDRVAVFGRVAPEHKLRIVEGFQRKGHVAAMTGDGVNDAPALAKADIGVAMGITGTEVAKEASAMVITDDNFATIVSAIEQGRIIFSNIRKAVYYLFSTSAAEIVALMTALIAGLPLPLRAVQILWVNLVTDGALTVNLVMEKAEGDEMRRPPLKRHAAMVPPPMLRRMYLLVPVMAFGTIGLFWWALESGRELVHAQTMAFTVLCAFQWFNGLNARSYHRSLFRLGLFTNPFVLAGLTAAIGLQVLVVHWTPLGNLFHTVPLTLAEWGLIVAVASSVLWVEELRKLFHHRTPADDE